MLFTAGLVLQGSGVALAQDRDAPKNVDEIVTIGTRVAGRTATETTAPIDIINTESINRFGQTETARLIQQLAPSFNFGNNTISDGSDISRPATLRGLGPDQVLVLINGKRNVGSAWVNIGESVGRGSAGVDLNSIPAASIARIEILRDGASSQYGSDAIAGVINIVLKDQAEGTQVIAEYGQTYQGDGDTYTVSINQGFKIGDGGFINLTGERRDRNFTNRANQSNRTLAGVNAGIPAVPTAGKTIFRIGDSDALNWQFMGNAMVPLGEDFEFYAFGKYMDRTGESTGFYRHPFTADRAVPQVFPNGFLPLQTTEVIEQSAVAGIRWDITDDWHMDASVNFGSNKFSFGAKNSINASIAAEFLDANPGATNAQIAANAGPTQVFSGALRVDQVIFDVDFNGQVDLGLPHPLYVATGFEQREETYRITQGDPASYQCGTNDSLTPHPSVVDPAQTANCGIQAFPGYSPTSAGKIDRDNIALYLDLETNILDNLLVSGAVRWENYSDVGDHFSGKVGTRYEFVDGFAMRGTFSKGFRAASLQQQGFTSVVTQGGASGLTQTLIANLNDPFSKALGIKKLDFETSTNFSLGFVWNSVPGLTVTVDAFHIKINNRIAFSQALGVGELTALGLTSAVTSLTSRGIGQGAVFFNAIDTRTRGIDIVASYDHDLGPGNLTTTLAVALNETAVKNKHAPAGIDPDVFFNRVSKTFVEDIQPNKRATLTLDYAWQNLSSLVRVNYYGATSNGFFTAEDIFGCPRDVACGPVTPFGLDPAGDTKVDSAFLVDLEFSLHVNEHLSVSLGANNVFDKKPDSLPNNSVIRWITDGAAFGGPPNTSFGNVKYPLRGVPYGINGGFYYFRTTLNF